MNPARPCCVVVDDDREFLARVQRWFVASCTDFEVLSFANSPEAVEFLRQKRVDLVVTAYLMPQIDGLQLISTLHALNARVPIFMTSSVPIKAAALARVATAFFTKGALWSQLGDALAKLGQAAAAPAA